MTVAAEINTSCVRSPIQEDLLEVLEKKGALTRGQIIKILKKPRTTVYDNLAILIDQKLVKKFSRMINSRGRPLVFFAIKRD